MTPPLVSILIPCHNAARWLAATLESALAQTWSHREIMVVNDGSRDGSLAVARSFESRGVRVVDQVNAGASAARNVLLRVARGDFVQFLDADDLIAPEKIARQLSLAVDPQILLSSNWARFYATPGDLSAPPQPLCRNFAPVDWVVAKLELHAMMHPAAWLVSRRLIERAGPWNDQISLDDDGEYFTRVVLCSQGVRCCRDTVSHYRSNLPGSLSGLKTDFAWASALLSLELSINRLLTVEDTARTRHAGATALQRLIYEAYPGAPDVRRLARIRVEALGGSDLVPSGGGKFQLTRRLVGWRMARRLQLLASRFSPPRAPRTATNPAQQAASPP